MPLLGPCACFHSSHEHSLTASHQKGITSFKAESCSDTHKHVLCKGYLDALGDFAIKQTDTAVVQYKGKDQQRHLGSLTAPGSFAISTGFIAGSTSSDTSVTASDAMPECKSMTTQQGQDYWQTGLTDNAQEASAHKRRMQKLLPNNLLGLQEKQSAHAAQVAAGDHAELYPYIHSDGRSIMSLSTLQHGMQHFIVPGVGYIAYAMMYNGPPVLNIRTAVALGDPICDPQHYHNIAQAFLKQHPKAMFAQISRRFAEVLQASGLLVNSLGGETHLDIRNFTFSGYAKRGLRSCMSSAVKEGYTVQEVMMHAAVSADISTAQKEGFWPALAAEMREVDQLWTAAKREKAGRVWFLNRPPVFAPEPAVRKFIARDGSGRLQAFIFLDAVYDGGNITGYYANVTRMRPDAHPGVLNLIIKEVIDRLRSEAQLSAPAKRLSIKKSQRKKLQQQTALGTAASGLAPSTDAPAEAAGPDSSTSKSSGLKFLSLGLSPFHQRDDSAFKHSKAMKRLMQFMYKHGTGFYPFKSLAAAKAKYGAGLHQGRYEDPNVTYNQVYLAHSHGKSAAAVVALFDFTVMLGMLSNPVEAVAGLLSYKVKRRMKKLKKRSPATQQ